MLTGGELRRAQAGNFGERGHHLSFDPLTPLDRQLLGESEVGILDRMRRQARQALAAGVTTIRDLGDRGYLGVRLRDEFAAAGSGPHIVAAGPPITITAGHCSVLGCIADDAATAVARVEQHAHHGVDVIKVMATGGMGADPEQAYYTAGEMKAIVEAAANHGLKVVAHAHASVGVGYAVAAGVHGVEHCTFMTGAGPSAEPRIVGEIAERGIFVGCTVARPRQDMPDAVPRTLDPYWNNHAYMWKQGVRTVCCTDAGINPLKPHDVLPDDLAYFASRVASASDTLACATSRAADACGLGGRKGHIAPGFDADLLAVVGDPTEDLAALRSVRRVYALGVPVG